MLDKILNLFPAKILQNVGASIVENLNQRGELKDWKSDEILDNLQKMYWYSGLQIQIVPCVRFNFWYWDWLVYDGHGVDLLTQGTATAENDAIASAMKWINGFVANDVNDVDNVDNLD